MVTRRWRSSLLETLRAQLPNLVGDLPRGTVSSESGAIAISCPKWETEFGN